MLDADEIDMLGEGDWPEEPSAYEVTIFDGEQSGFKCTMLGQMGVIIADKSRDRPAGFVFTDTEWNSWIVVRDNEGKYNIAATVSKEELSRRYDGDDMMDVNFPMNSGAVISLLNRKGVVPEYMVKPSVRHMEMYLNGGTYPTYR